MFSDVDSAYATIESNLTLLRPYKETYLKEAVEVLRELKKVDEVLGYASLAQRLLFIGVCEDEVAVLGRRDNQDGVSNSTVFIGKSQCPSRISNRRCSSRWNVS